MESEASDRQTKTDRKSPSRFQELWDIMKGARSPEDPSFEEANRELQLIADDYWERRERREEAELER
jgi:hypothetical protein